MFERLEHIPDEVVDKAVESLQEGQACRFTLDPSGVVMIVSPRPQHELGMSLGVVTRAPGGYLLRPCPLTPLQHQVVHAWADNTARRIRDRWIELHPLGWRLGITEGERLALYGTYPEHAERLPDLIELFETDFGRFVAEQIPDELSLEAFAIAHAPVENSQVVLGLFRLALTKRPAPVSYFTCTHCTSAGFDKPWVGTSIVERCPQCEQAGHVIALGEAESAELTDALRTLDERPFKNDARKLRSGPGTPMEDG